MIRNRIGLGAVRMYGEILVQERNMDNFGVIELRRECISIGARKECGRLRAMKFEGGAAWGGIKTEAVVR